jgi:hypothetical protein
MEETEKKTMQYKVKLNIENTVLKGETTLALLKQIFDKKETSRMIGHSPLISVQLTLTILLHHTKEDGELRLVLEFRMRHI